MARKKITVLFTNSDGKAEEWLLPIDSSATFEDVLASTSEVVAALRKGGAALQEGEEYTLSFTGLVFDPHLRLETDDEGGTFGSTAHPKRPDAGG